MRTVIVCAIVGAMLVGWIVAFMLACMKVTGRNDEEKKR